jgi:uncharacterized protein (DUF2147 family)
VSTWIIRRCCLAFLIAAAACLAADGWADITPERQIVGTWLTQDKDAAIEIYFTQAGGLEGRIVGGSGVSEPFDDKNPDPVLRTRPLNGAVILRGFRYAGDGRWTDGTIYDPNNGKTYKCNMQLKDADTLSIRGYIGVSLFGRSSLWIRKRA